jgi:hypothetical protein
VGRPIDEASPDPVKMSFNILLGHRHAVVYMHLIVEYLYARYD